MKKKIGAFGAGQFSLGTLAGGRPGTTIFQNPGGGGGGGGLGGVAYKDRARPPPRGLAPPPPPCRPCPPPPVPRPRGVANPGSVKLARVPLE